MFLTILLFVVVLAVIVLFHEFGHFAVAKLSGTRVEEFGIGFPPRLFGIKRGETIYSVNLLPLGGFVKIFGEEGDNRNDPRSFGSRPIFLRGAILVAGVCMNVFLAFLIYSAMNMTGMPTTLNDNATVSAKDIRVQIMDVIPNSPAAVAGLMAGDTIQTILSPQGTQKINTMQDVRTIVESEKGVPITMTIMRGSQTKSITLTPRFQAPEGQGATGIALARTGIVSYSPPQAIIQGAQTTLGNLQALGSGFGQMIKSLFSSGGFSGTVTGPVGIARIFSQVRGEGILYVLEFMAFISLNLALLNIIPFPALDGGRLFFLLIEAVKGSPLPQKIEQGINAAGFALLILLMVLVTIHDVFPM